MDEQLPPMPEPARKENWMTNPPRLAMAWYTQDQMHAYAAEAVRVERERCAGVASMFSMEPENCTVHPYLPFGKMSESAQKIAHATAQGIADAIRNPQGDA